MLLRAREAAQFLRPRQRRAYQVFEEAKQGHLERECVEEVCSKEEAREVFENDPETVSGPQGLRVGGLCVPEPILLGATSADSHPVQVQETRGLWNPRHLFWRVKDPCVDRATTCTPELLDSEPRSHPTCTSPFLSHSSSDDPPGPLLFGSRRRALEWAPLRSLQ